MRARGKGLAKGCSALAATVALAMLAGCGEPSSGPIRVSAVGGAPRMVNPNLVPLDPPSALLLESTAQGLVRFDAGGEIEPALAQSWIVSDDGRRYTFRIRRIEWAPDGARVTAEQVAARLRAAVSRASRNRLKPVLGAIDTIVAMTDEVLEISLHGPRPNMLQILAQPELAILQGRRGTGPYVIGEADAGSVRLALPQRDDEDERAGRIDLLLRGERAALAVARFAGDEADLVVGGTIADLAIARAAGLPNNRLSFDPVHGLFGLAFATNATPFDDPAVRRALTMAIDREGLIEALGAPGMEARITIVPPGLEELPRPTLPDWAGGSLSARRAAAAAAITALPSPPRLRVAMPDGPGYRILFARLRRDWRLIGVEAERVAPTAPAELRLVDGVAPAVLATWYLRHFTCDSSAICSPDADAALVAARAAPSLRERQAHLAKADGILSVRTPFIPLATPVRWSLVSRRLTGFRPNMFARHPAVTLIAEEP
jgi:peptide/nickel transport system substrate-binding protein